MSDINTNGGDSPNPEVDQPIGVQDETGDEAYAERSDQAALGTPLPVETDEADLTDVEKRAKEHQERNSLETVNRAGYTPDAPHPSEREPNPAFGRRDKE